MEDLPRKDHPVRYFGPRVRVAVFFIVAAMLILGGRLWQLQLIQGESFGDLSRSNRVRLIRLPPARGKILDSNKRVMAENVPTFAFSVVPGELKDPQEVVLACAPILGVTEERLRGLVDRSRSSPRFINFPLKRNMTLEEVSLLRSHVSELRGVTLEIKPRRRYPLGETLCHVVGTMGEISGEELNRGSGHGYRVGDMLGKTGIERDYESLLRGEEGWEEIEIDAKGRQLGILSRKAPIAGADVRLTVDAELQRYAEETFIHRAGSIVVVEPDTGRIIAMVGKPGFDLNLFSPSISERQWKALNKDQLHPLENRSVRGLYSPASTFKIVTAAAGLAEKVIRPDYKCVCKGQLELHGQVFRCWNEYGHGKVDLQRALVESCDVYFYELGLRLGGDRISKYASLFGFGQPTGIGIAQEMPGLLPTSAWKQRTYGSPWKDGETVTLAIGQGYFTCTPVQLAMMTATMANGGKVLKPAIVQEVTASDGNIIHEHTPTVRWMLSMDTDDARILREALTAVVSDRRGTGRKCRIPGINVRAKTGTSQVISAKRRPSEEEQIPYHERTHAIFVAYVDDRPKKVAVAVIIEHGGGGGAAAAPIARKIIARYYGVPDPGDPAE